MNRRDSQLKRNIIFFFKLKLADKTGKTEKTERSQKTNETIQQRKTKNQFNKENVEKTQYWENRRTRQMKNFRGHRDATFSKRKTEIMDGFNIEQSILIFSAILFTDSEYMLDSFKSY